MNGSQQSTSSVSSDRLYSPNTTDDGSSFQQDTRGAIWQPPYFPTLNAEDEFDIHDLEMTGDAEKKETNILVRPRWYSTRPAYKIEKTTRAHFMGKKNISMLISRSEGWDSATAKPVASVSQSKPVRGYTLIFRALDQNPRHITLTPTKGMVLKSTLRGGDITLAPYCGSYDPQRSRIPQPRTCLSYHYLPLHLTEFERSPPVPGQAMPRGPPPALTKPYSGGGYLIFDASSRGRSELLSTLYCTGYERRPVPRKGDVVLAELRLSRPADPSRREHSPSWTRLFRERYASLFISKRGLETVFTGRHVNLAVPNAVEGNRYKITTGQAHEVIISLFATSILTIEHEGFEKKWAWLLNREALEASAGIPLEDGAPAPPPLPLFQGQPTPKDPSMMEKYPHLSVESRFESMSIADATSLDDRARSMKHKSSFDQWKVVSYNSDGVLRGSPISSGFSATTEPLHHEEGDEGADQLSPEIDKHQLSPLDEFDYARRASTALQRVQVPDEVISKVTEERTESPEGLKAWPKEGPKVTGRPKPGVDGGIYW